MIGRTLSHFRVVEKIGEGGMGIVYKAIDENLHRPVALKVLPPEFAGDAERRARFLREARAAAAVAHPNIAAIHEIDEADGVVFIAMEYVEGTTLRALLAGKPLPLAEALPIASQIAAALDRAHRANVIHRDLKPENVMVGPDGAAKILDFGLAHFRAERATTAGPLASGMATTPLVTLVEGGAAGTPAYMSPEQARGQRVDARSDLFSFGVVLYEMLTGARPFHGDTSVDMLSSILRDAPAAPSKLAPSLPAGVDAIVSKCLAKERDDRYASAAEIREDLGKLLHPSAPVAPRGGALARRLVAVFALLMAAALAVRIFDPLGWRRPGAATSATALHTLAVLPFKSIGGGAPDDLLGLGIADTIITKVSQIGSLTVRPTSAIRRYAAGEVDPLVAARELQVDTILDGSVQRSGDRLRVNVNLLRVGDGASLMAESLEMGFTEIFAIQDRVAREVASRLEVSLSPRERERLAKKYTESTEGYEHYLRGQQAFEQRDIWVGQKPVIDSAIASFQRAIDVDPNYALARAELAHAYAWMGLYVERQVGWIEKAEKELDEAARLDPTLAEIHVVRGDVLWSAYKGWEIAGAVREFRTAESLNPSVGHAEAGTIFYHLGLEEPALRELRRAMEIDPRGSDTFVRLREGLILLGHLDEAVAMRGPSNAAGTRTLALIFQGKLDEAEASLQEELAGDPANPYVQSQGAILLALRGKFAEAESRLPAIVAKAGSGRAFHHVAYACAQIYALQGKGTEAAAWLRRTAETGMPDYPLFARDKLLDRIRSDAAYTAFMSELRPKWETLRAEFE
ncbi:MAG: protein kinase [Acidobacteria bacterium]|nr:protein kinase [Acidobacteriota bacterium]